MMIRSPFPMITTVAGSAAKSAVLLVALLFSAAVARPCVAQSASEKPAVPAQTHGAISFAVTFDGTIANITTANSFWLKGGSAEINASLPDGLGFAADLTGLHTGNSGGGVPVNLLVATFGPSYTAHPHLGKRPATLYGHGLVGVVDGFNGVYPKSPAPGTYANALAFKIGGGLDLAISRYFSVRLVEANWLRTQLPNATTNVQNDVELGTGIVFHTSPR